MLTHRYLTLTRYVTPPRRSHRTQYLVQASSESEPRQLLNIPRHTRSKNQTTKKSTHTTTRIRWCSFLPFPEFRQLRRTGPWRAEDGDSFCVKTSCSTRNSCVYFFPLASHAERTSGGSTPVRQRADRHDSLRRPPDVSPLLDPRLPRTPSETFAEPTPTSHVGVPLPPHISSFAPHVTNPKGLFAQK